MVNNRTINSLSALRKYLMDNPEICYMILAFSISSPVGGGMMGRMVSQTHQNGYKVTVEADDDKLTPEERKRRDADLADKAIRVLMTMGKRGA